MEVFFVYGLVVLFFIGIVGIVVFVVGPNSKQLADQSQDNARAQLDGQQSSSVLNYGIVAVLFLLLIAFTFISRKFQYPQSRS